MVNRAFETSHVDMPVAVALFISCFQMTLCIDSLFAARERKVAPSTRCLQMFPLSCHRAPARLTEINLTSCAYHDKTFNSVTVGLTKTHHYRLYRKTDLSGYFLLLFSNLVYNYIFVLDSNHVLTPISLTSLRSHSEVLTSHFSVGHS